MKKIEQPANIDIEDFWGKVVRGQQETQKRLEEYDAMYLARTKDIDPKVLDPHADNPYVIQQKLEYAAKDAGGMSLDAISQALNVDMGGRVTNLCKDQEGNYFTVVDVVAENESIQWHKTLILQKVQ